MNRQSWKKSLTIGIIFFFIGVAVAPGINSSVVKASTDNDLVEVTSQAVGVQGFRNTTVKLTKHQYQDLEQYLVKFKARLNQTTTREEAVPIFKDAVVELNKYGLLPKGMNVEQTQRLVVGVFQNQKKNNPFQGRGRNNHAVSNNTSNYACLVASYLSESYSFTPITKNAIRLVFIVDEVLHHLNPLGFLLYYTFVISTIDMVFSSINPFSLFSTICIGGTEVRLHYPNYYYVDVASAGWMFTAGINGIRTIKGESLWGTLPQLSIFNIAGQYYPGVYGFTGLKIHNLSSGKAVYLGSALWVKIGTAKPAY